MHTRLETFLDLSVCLTGFDLVRLQGTAMGGAYLDACDGIVTPAFMDALFSTFRALPEGEGLETALSSHILDDTRFGPVARNIMVLWYCGTWKQLPPEWRADHVASPADVDHLVSADAYLTGLQWTVVGAHPAGAMPPGYASWAAPAE